MEVGMRSWTHAAAIATLRPLHFDNYCAPPQLQRSRAPPRPDSPCARPRGPSSGPRRRTSDPAPVVAGHCRDAAHRGCQFQTARVYILGLTWSLTVPLHAIARISAGLLRSAHGRLTRHAHVVCSAGIASRVVEREGEGIRHAVGPCAMHTTDAESDVSTTRISTRLDSGRSEQSRPAQLHNNSVLVQQYLNASRTGKITLLIKGFHAVRQGWIHYICTDFRMYCMQ
jgi:hypothetical protein